MGQWFSSTAAAAKTPAPPTPTSSAAAATSGTSATPTTATPKSPRLQVVDSISPAASKPAEKAGWFTSFASFKQRFSDFVSWLFSFFKKPAA